MGIENVNSVSVGSAERGLNSGAAMLRGLPKDGTREWEEVDVGVDAAAPADVAPPGCHGSALALRGCPNTKGLAKGLRESRRAAEFPADVCG